MTRRPGPYTRTDLTKLDGRRKESAFLKGVRAELVEHVGGDPTAPQRALIESAAQLRLRISMMDRKLTESKATTPNEHDTATYLAWSGTLARTMKTLDSMRGSSVMPVPSIHDLLATPAPARRAPSAPVAAIPDTDDEEDDDEAWPGACEAAP
jgi:hypothetical protein